MDWVVIITFSNVVSIKCFLRCFPKKKSLYCYKLLSNMLEVRRDSKWVIEIVSDQNGSFRVVLACNVRSFTTVFFVVLFFPFFLVSFSVMVWQKFLCQRFIIHYPWTVWPELGLVISCVMCFRGKQHWRIYLKACGIILLNH